MPAAVGDAGDADARGVGARRRAGQRRDHVAQVGDVVGLARQLARHVPERAGARRGRVGDHEAALVGQPRVAGVAGDVAARSARRRAARATSGRRRGAGPAARAGRPARARPRPRCGACPRPAARSAALRPHAGRPGRAARAPDAATTPPATSAHDSHGERCAPPPPPTGVSDGPPPGRAEDQEPGEGVSGDGHERDHDDLGGQTAHVEVGADQDDAGCAEPGTERLHDDVAHQSRRSARGTAERPAPVEHVAVDGARREGHRGGGGRRAPEPRQPREDREREQRVEHPHDTEAHQPRDLGAHRTRCCS